MFKEKTNLKLFNKYAQKRQLDWNNGADYQFDHMAVSSKRQLRRDDDGIDEGANIVDAELSGANPPEGVPGEPGVDYPILPSIPLTNFHCRGRVPGYYGDTETACQVISESRLCPSSILILLKNYGKL